MKIRLFVILICLASLTGIQCSFFSSGKKTAPPKIDVKIVLLDKNEKASTTFFPDEPINVEISLKNLSSTDLITSAMFTKRDFRRHIRFFDPDGRSISAKLPQKLPEPSAPKILPIKGKAVQVEDVEILKPDWEMKVKPFDARRYYFVKADKYRNVKYRGGNYSVVAYIPMRTYPKDVLIQSSNKWYAPIRAANWIGELKSKPLNLTIITDADGDGYYYPLPYGKAHQNLIDCDDTDPRVNPSAKETEGNGKDDDCNPATPDKPVVTPDAMKK